MNELENVRYTLAMAGIWLLLAIIILADKLWLSRNHDAFQYTTLRVVIRSSSLALVSDKFSGLFLQT